MNIRSVITVFAAMLLMAACRGTSEELGANLRLSADRASIVADGTDAVTFTVSDGAADLTSDALIVCETLGNTLSGNTFSTTDAGLYVFHAEYGGWTSPQVTVTAEPATADVESQFVRKVCVMEFTGQWCSNCPDGWNYLNFVVSRNFPEDVEIIALHDNTSGQDEFAIDAQREISTAFNIGEYPYFLIDMRESAGRDIALSQAIRASLSEGPHCGVALKSSYDETAGSASVTVKVFSELTSVYRVALYVVEDNITARQNYHGIYEENYTHHHVARLLVSDSWRGDSLGSVAAGSEAEKTYTVTADPDWNLDNVTVLALAVDADGEVNNLAVCAFTDGDTPYLYKQ